MLSFKTLRWKNFLSTGNNFTEIYLGKYHSALISGDNGAGKSTMLDALTFVLFSKSFRGINIQSLVNSINEKDCVVEVEFSTTKHEYMIKRGLSPKIFEIYKDGVLIPQNATVKDYQEILENQILKMSYKAFCQVVILGSSNYIPFMKLSIKDRRKIVEDLLDINVFSVMNTLLKAKISENKDKLMLANNKLKVLQTKIQGHDELVNRMEKKSKESIDSNKEELKKMNEQVEALTKEVEELQTQLEPLLESIDKKNSLDKQLLKAEDIKKKMGRNVKKTEEEIRFYDDNNACPTCGQEITCNHKKKEVDDKKGKITELEKAANDIGGVIDSIESNINDLNSVLEVICDIEGNIVEKNNSISACNKYVTKVNGDIEEILNDKEELAKEKERSDKMGEELARFDDVKRNLSEKKACYDISASLLKDDGIKSKIVRYYLPIMNKLINQYLTSMDFFCQFILDENFSETIKSRYRDDFTYYNFSEGERLRIDLSLLLAWREIARLKNSVNCNLLILDEVFDSSLDSVGTEEFLKILNSFGNRANVFVITHKADQLMDKFKNHIHFVKKNNFSGIVV